MLLKIAFIKKKRKKTEKMLNKQKIAANKT